ncbi:hypothetical protein CHISP_2441 [Chitinispirillum alkaliphilum]|nr:hypothetical protein CHISP_2441 [Chitinispirillum alkaliphilum]
MRTFVASLIYFAVIVLHGCSLDLAGGGNSTETGNPVIMGNVTDQHGKSMENATVTLRSVLITEEGDRGSADTSVFTDSTGFYSFFSPEAGRYVIFSNFQEQHIAAVESRLETNSTSQNQSFDLTLKPTLTLTGTVVPDPSTQPQDISIIIPGTEKITRPNNVGRFRLTDIPQGHFDIGFIFGNTVNYLPVTVRQENSDTISLGTINLRAALDSNTVEYSYYRTSLDKNLALLPQNNVRGHDTTSVVLFETDSIHKPIDVIWPKPLWRFSVVVGVEDSTVSSYGGLENTVQHIRTLFKKANDKFNSTDDFDGYIYFEIDSLYTYSNNTKEEIIDPPPNVDYRFVIDRFTDRGAAYWRPINTMGLFPTPTFNGDILHSYAVDATAFLFAAMRGVSTLANTAVQESKNPVNNTSYNSENSIMSWPYDVDNWCKWSQNIINYNKNKPIDRELVRKTAIPQIRLNVTDSYGSPVPGAVIELFSVRDSSVSDTPFLTGITGQNGTIYMPRDVYQRRTGETVSTIFNLLVRASDSDNTAYAWMPVYEVNNAWFENPDTLYQVDLMFQ